LRVRAAVSLVATLALAAAALLSPTASRRLRRLRARQLDRALRHRAGARPAVGADGAADRAGGAARCYAIGGWDLKGKHFHALFQLQLIGLNGAFLTGDLFNLFVFFEILLIASYGLLLHGGGQPRLKAGLHYVGINLVGSALFLFASAALWRHRHAEHGRPRGAHRRQTPEADIARRARAAAACCSSACSRQVGALLPLYFWLPAPMPAHRRR
jgi:formate hydrogenlyase subunit 3/multisubunit Na+/H+ antiporter MnhD subunit